MSRLAAPSAIAGSVLICLPMLTYPMGKDQAFYAYAGWVLREGGVPGIDWWAQTPPGMAGLCALSQFLFGHTSMAIRWLDLLWSVATAVSLGALGKRICGSSWGWIAAPIWAWAYAANYNYWHSAQVDGFLTLPAIGVLLLARRGSIDQRPSSWLAAGALLGQAFMIKYVALSVSLPLAAFLWASKGSRRFSPAVLVPLLWTASGFALGTAPWLAWLGWTGSLWHLIATQREVLVSYAASTFSNGLGFVGGTSWWLLTTHLGLLAFSGLGVWELRQRSAGDRALTLGWMAAALIGFAAQLKFFLYHSLPLLGPFALLATLGVRRVTRAPRWVVVAALCVLVSTQVTAVQFWSRSARDLFVVATTEASPVDLWLSGRPRGSRLITPNLQLAEIIRAETSTHDSVYVWGYEPLVNYAAQRRSPTRFITNGPLIAVWGNPAWRTELVSDLRRRRPSHIVVCHDDQASFVTGTSSDSASMLGSFVELQELLDRDFNLVWQNRLFSFYRRQDWLNLENLGPS